MTIASPNLYFNASHYLIHNPDVFIGGLNTPAAAWQHYAQYGAAEALLGAEARSPTPWFDAAAYLALHPDLAAAGLAPADLFTHFTTWGILEGRTPKTGFHVTHDELLAYAAANPDLQQAFGISGAGSLSPTQYEALARHLYQYGYAENRAGSPFDRAPPSDPHLFTLSEQIETLQGCEADDRFVATTIWADGDQVNTLQLGDVLHGGGGLDTLALETVGGILAPRITGIEHLLVTSYFPSVLDLAYTQGVSQITVQQSMGAATLRHVPDLVDLVLRDLVATHDGMQGNPITLSYGAQALAGHSVQTITLDNVHLQSGGVYLYLDAVGADTVEALSITVDRASSLAGIAAAPDPGSWAAAYHDLTGLTVVRVQAQAAVDLGHLAAPDLLQFDASGSRAGVSVDLSGVDSNSLRVQGGAGDDLFILDPVAHADQVVQLSLGGGSDTLQLLGVTAGDSLSFQDDGGRVLLQWHQGGDIRLLAVIDDVSPAQAAEMLTLLY